MMTQLTNQTSKLRQVNYLINQLLILAFFYVQDLTPHTLTLQKAQFQLSNTLKWLQPSPPSSTTIFFQKLEETPSNYHLNSLNLYHSQTPTFPTLLARGSALKRGQKGYKFAGPALAQIEYKHHYNISRVFLFTFQASCMNYV